jgi:hypothetical protein
MNPASEKSHIREMQLKYHILKYIIIAASKRNEYQELNK